MTDPETTALVVQVAQHLPPIIQRNLWTSVGTLVGALVDWPVAWLEGKAKAIRAKADAEVEAITAIGHRSAERLQTDPAVLARAQEAFISRQYRAQSNRESIAGKATNELSKYLSTEDATRQIDPDWLDVFSRHAETKSNEEMQLYFARLLAGEIRKPGAFSPATLEVLARLTPDLATLFAGLCDISSVLEEGEPNPPIGVLMTLEGHPRELDPFGFSFLQLTELQDAGLISHNYDAVWEAAPHDLLTRGIICGGRHIGFRSPMEAEMYMEAKKVESTVLLFTRAGRELRRLVDLRPNAEYFAMLQKWFAKALAEHGITVTGSAGQTDVTAVVGADYTGTPTGGAPTTGTRA